MTDRINPDFHWSRGTSGDRYRPTHDCPNLFISLADLYTSIETRPQFNDPTQDRISAWIERYGRLYAEVGLDSRESTLELFVEHAGVLAWCWRTINTLKELGHDYRAISIFEADAIRVTVENPRRFVPALDLVAPVVLDEANQIIEHPKPSHRFHAANLARESGVRDTDETWTTAYSVVFGGIRETIQQFVTNQTEIRFGEVWKVPRTRHGDRVKIKKDVDGSGIFHGLDTIVEPKSLIGYIWFGLLQYFQDPSGVEYYECANFGYCGQWLNKKPSSKSRRIYCTDACRARHKRAQKKA